MGWKTFSNLVSWQCSEESLSLGGQEGASLDSAWWGALRILIVIPRPMESFKGIQAGDTWSRLRVEYCDHSLETHWELCQQPQKKQEKSHNERHPCGWRTVKGLGWDLGGKITVLVSRKCHTHVQYTECFRALQILLLVSSRIHVLINSKVSQIQVCCLSWGPLSIKMASETKIRYWFCWSK